MKTPQAPTTSEAPVGWGAVVRLSLVPLTFINIPLIFYFDGPLRRGIDDHQRALAVLVGIVLFGVSVLPGLVIAHRWRTRRFARGITVALVASGIEMPLLVGALLFIGGPEALFSDDLGNGAASLLLIAACSGPVAGVVAVLVGWILDARNGEPSPG